MTSERWTDYREQTGLNTPDLAFSTKHGNKTQLTKRRVRVLVTLPYIIPVEPSRFPAVHSGEVGSRVVSPQLVLSGSKNCEGGMEAMMQGRC